MKNRIVKGLLALLLVFAMLLPEAAVLAAGENQSTFRVVSQQLARSRKKKKNKNTTTTAGKEQNEQKEQATAASGQETEAQEPTATPVPDGPITDIQSIADYLFANGCLPDNFMTKKEAKALGWPGGDLTRYAPGMSIGGDYFGNYEGVLPTKDENGRKITYNECDVNYHGGSRGADRIVFSSNGHVYYTSDHYASFTEIFPSVPGSQKYFEFKVN